MPAGWKQLTYTDRLKIEALHRAKVSNGKIAEQIGCHRTTIGRELKRGLYEHTKSDLTTEMRYSPEISQEKRDETNKNRGVQLKIGKDKKYADYLEEQILSGLSPAAVLGRLKVEGKEKQFNTRICATTLYSYIQKEVFLTLSLKDLPEKGKPQNKHKKKIQRQKRANAGTSIEKRPEEINNREEFGHWEMDSVVGPQGQSRSTMLVLSERKTRKEIIVHLPDHTADAVVNAVNALEKEWGTIFTKVFKTITVDNGSEFALSEDLEKSVIGEGQRTKLYYCHPYRSSERGTNENLNRMIRRKIPKGTVFDNEPDEVFEAIADWMNNYPRRILGYRTAEECFKEELKNIAV